jgi:hypothetical protein
MTSNSLRSACLSRWRRRYPACCCFGRTPERRKLRARDDRHSAPAKAALLSLHRTRIEEPQLTATLNTKLLSLVSAAAFFLPAAAAALNQAAMIVA